MTAKKTQKTKRRTMGTLRDLRVKPKDVTAIKGGSTGNEPGTMKRGI